jgi:SagB-type dehydrogenase family enzyme
MMSVLLAARALGLPGGAITHFSDSRLTHALGLTGGDEAPMAFLVFPPKSSFGQRSVPLQETFAGVPNELSAEEVPYELLLEIHRSTILPDPAGPPPRPHAANATPSDEHSRKPARDGSMKDVVRRRRSALDFDARSQPMERSEVEQLLDFATRDWPADWRGTFGSEAGAVGTGTDFVTLYVYVHRVRDCEPGVYRWNSRSCRLEQLHRSNVERVAAFLSLEQTLAGNACFAISMVADLAMAAQVFGNRGYRYVYFEAGAIGQKLYVGAETLGWNATGIGAFYDDDVHRYLGFLEETDSSVDPSVDAAEQATLIMLGSPASRSAAAQGADSLREPSGKRRVHKGEAASWAETSQLSQQVIYHFAVGRAIPDPRLEA